MANPHFAPPLPAPLEDALAEAKSSAKEQLQAAAQLHIDRLAEELSSGWRAHVEQVFEERLTELGARIQAHYRAECETESARARQKARRDLAGQLNRAGRSLRNFENEAQWSRAVVDATDGLCDRAALFVVNQQNLELRAARNLPAESLDRIPLQTAPAFLSAVETKETVVALRTRGELSEPVANLVGDAPDRKSSVFPLATRDRVAAVLYADSDDNGLETNALELLAAFASTVIEGLGTRASQLHTLGPAPSKPATTWAALSKTEQDLHLRAQRSARVRVSEMRLYKSQAVKEGRAGRNLYAALQPDIDTGREAFRRDFMAASDSMVDYFHLELVRTLANDDADLLGSDYPGPMA